MDSKLISKARRSAVKAKIRMACVACIAYKHRCSDSRPCKSCLKANRQCVDGANLSSKYDSGSRDSPRIAPQLHSLFVTERDSRTRSGRSGLEWAHCEARNLMGMGFRVEFLERFISHLNASDGWELDNAMVMSALSSTSSTAHECSSLVGADSKGSHEVNTQWNSETDAIFCTTMDFTTGRRSFYSNPNNASLFGMHCEELTTRLSHCQIAVPYSEVDALILLLYRSVYRFRSQEPAEMFLRMYIGTTRMGSLIRESCTVENDELHRPKKVALSPICTLIFHCLKEYYVTRHRMNCTDQMFLRASLFVSFLLFRCFWMKLSKQY